MKLKKDSPKKKPVREKSKKEIIILETVGMSLLVLSFACILIPAFLSVGNGHFRYSMPFLIAFFVLCISSIAVLIYVFPDAVVNDLHRSVDKYSNQNLSILHHVEKERTIELFRSHGFKEKSGGFYRKKMFSFSKDGGPEDDYIDRIGFREVMVSGKDILVNGRKIYMKGFNRHEDYAVVGCAIPLQLMVQDMELMQEMNANAVRTCHYPNDERFLDLCDERGMYVWEENHARGFGLERMQNPNFDRQCRDCIDEMIEDHFNHPSIVIWGILNECASETEEGREKYAAQYAQIRSLDKSRPVTSATCRHLKDICLDLPDVVSFNMYSGWYKDVPIDETNNTEIEWIRNSGGDGKPIIVSEFGAAAIYGYRDRAHCKWSEERQADIIRDNLEVYMKDDNICGVFVWQFADCRVTEEEWFATRARCHNNKGVVDEYRRPKLAFDTIKEMYEKYRK